MIQETGMRAPAMALVLAITISPSFAAKAQGGQTAAPSPYPSVQGKNYKFEKVAEGVYYATSGFGGNIPVIVNDSNVMIVDDGTTPASARALLKDLTLIT